MNTKKHKNKTKPKPANPQRKPENVEQEKIETDVDIKKIPEVTKNEERVPEIVSEIVTPPIEATASESDTPKKPKRNRGKKKKFDKEDEVEEQEQKLFEHTSEEKKEPIEIQESKDAKTSEDKLDTTTEVAPVARKKKNKNKKQSEQNFEEFTEQEIRIVPLKKGEELTDVKIITCVPIETEESKASKKKNKKKKRTDSERSEKQDETISCTAAFQKLLEYKDDKKENKKETKSEDKPLADVEDAETTKEEDVKASVHLDIAKQEIETKPSNIADAPKDESGKSKKKNKKDKKHLLKPETEDDLQTSSENLPEIKNDIALKDLSSTTAAIDETLIKVESTVTGQFEKDKQVDVIAADKHPVEREKSPKPKAKIAKPVDKKRKGKTEMSSNEELSEKATESAIIKEKSGDKDTEILDVEIIPEIKTAEEKTTELSERSGESGITTKVLLESISDFKSSQKIVEPVAMISTPEPEYEIELKTEEALPQQKEQQAQQKEQVIETIQIPEIETRKKRKKSPKPKPQNIEIKKTISADIEDVTENVEKSLTNLDEPKTETVIISENAPIPITESKIQIVEQECIPESESDKTPKKDTAIPLSFNIHIQMPPQTKVLETPDISNIPDMPKEAISKESKHLETDKVHMPEVSSGKKRKKSPKPKSAETSESKIQREKSHIFARDINVSHESVRQVPVDQAEMKNIPDKQIFEDIEIRSVKADESEGSVCDIVPDIHYPRASSQLMDDNNNMTIRDVTSEPKLNIPTVSSDIPIIQGSGESPLSPPELIPLDIQFTEIKTPTAKPEEPVAQKTSEKDTKISKPEEKTDLKSKVLDVNQGMEELRKSIERSLAELSAMEKSEKDAEEQFAKAQEKLEGIKEMAGKKSEEKRKGDSKSESVLPQIEKTLAHKEPETETLIPEEQKSAKKIDESQVLLSQAPSTTVIKPEDEKLFVAAKLVESPTPPPPVCPARKDNKGKGKKKKGKQESEPTATSTTTECATSAASTQESTGSSSEAKDTKEKEKTEQKSDTQEKGKQQAASTEKDNVINEVIQDSVTDSTNKNFQPIENFEDALTSSVDDVNKTFEIIVNESNQVDQSQNPEINVTAPVEDDDKEDKKEPKDENVNPLSQPKNLLGHPAIPARLNKTDYKKEKNKPPNTRQAKVKIKDAVPIEVAKQTKECQTENKRRFLKDKTASESITSVTNQDEEYIYKYSFRKVFLPSACHICKKDLKQLRVPCNYCNLVFYCSPKHKNEDNAQHQALCFAVSTIVHLKDQNHIYAEAANITGYEYRLLRMQMIVSCEKILKRRLVPWEQEALLYPRICADVACREWRQNKLVDCEGCAQISYCSDHPNHLPKSHQRWCKSYWLYHRLVVYQQTRGRLEPQLPTRVVAELAPVAETLNKVLADLYEEKIDMSDIQYASVTQIATAPLTAAYCQQIYSSKLNATCANGVHKKSSFTIHVVGAELQFEADALNKWEVFFLHLRPDIKDLRVVLVGPDLNPSKLPLDLLGKIKMCDNCRQNRRRVLFDFQENKTYQEYWGTDFVTPDMVCVFNPSIQRSSIFNGKDTWPSTINCILKLKVPFLITAHTMSELDRDVARIKECSEIAVNIISEPKYNAFASVRPDRNFISDDEMPLLFKNFCFAVVSGDF